MESMANMNCSRLVIHIVTFLIANLCLCEAICIEVESHIPIGVVLDTNSQLGSMLDVCIKMAISDFYANNSNYATRLQLHTRNADTLLDANLAVVNLLEHEGVQVMIGPQGSTQDIFVSELGEKSQVPVLSFTARSSALYDSTTKNKFYVRTSVDDSIQARAVADVCRAFHWPQVVVLYEDTEYGHQFHSHLTNAFRDVEIRLTHLSPISLSANDYHISELLSWLNGQETRVFLVHMSPSLGFRLFNIAKNTGMMAEGYAWIITDSLSNFLSSMDAAIRDSMEGVVAVRPYVPSSKELTSFQERLEINSSRAYRDLNVYGLWAYDTIKALAIAAESIAPLSPPCKNKIVRDASLRISLYGPRILRELSRTRFRGLSGYFQLIDGRLKPSEFEIVNLIGTGEKRVGLWNPHNGIRKAANDVQWPGDTTTTPKGWSIPPSGSLRVGVPWKPGFKEFVDVVIDPATNETRVTGFSVDIFLHALKQLPFPVNYTFHCYNDSTSSNWSYDNMLHEIPQNYDMVVADTTIWAPRASYVDFTLPYAESELVLVVRNNRPFNMWIFMRPLRWDLWVTIVAACVFMGFVIWRLESLVHNPAPERREEDRLKVPFLVPFAALAFQERALVKRKTSLFVLVCWLFTAFVLMQSYTANLSAMLTLDHLRFSFSEDHYFGYHKGSFTREFLTEKLHIDPTRLIPFESGEEYHEAMRRGSRNGGIDGIFDELPYMKILMNRYYAQYKIIGPKYRTDGLGFSLPIGSPLVAHFSRAILNVTQGSDMIALEEKNFGPGYSSLDPLLDTVSQGASSLTSRDFAGLFILAAFFTTAALVYAESANMNTDQFSSMLRGRTNGGYNPVANGGNDAPAAGAAVEEEGNAQDRGAAAGGGGGGSGNAQDATAVAGGGGGGGGDGSTEDVIAGGGDGNGEDRRADVNQARRELA